MSFPRKRESIMNFLTQRRPPSCLGWQMNAENVRGDLTVRVSPLPPFLKGGQGDFPFCLTENSGT